METTRITQHNVLGIYYGRRRAETYQTVDLVIVTTGGTLALTLFSSLGAVVPIVEIEEPHGADVMGVAIEAQKGAI